MWHEKEDRENATRTTRTEMRLCSKNSFAVRPLALIPLALIPPPRSLHTKRSSTSSSQKRSPSDSFQGSTVSNATSSRRSSFWKRTDAFSERGGPGASPPKPSSKPLKIHMPRRTMRGPCLSSSLTTLEPVLKATTKALMTSKTVPRSHKALWSVSVSASMSFVSKNAQLRLVRCTLARTV